MPPPAAESAQTWFRRSSSTVLLSVAVAVLGACELPAAEPTPPVPRTTETSGLEFITPECQKAIDRGLAYLAIRQNDDGSFGSGSMRRNVAITGLGGMAFLAAGHTPRAGRYGKNVSAALEFILSRCQATGFIVAEDSKSHGPMYGHGFATLFLAEIHGMTSRKDVHEKLRKAVKLIVDTQNAEGGWRYYPERKDADVSVTVCQIMALRAARNAGISVPKTTVENCVEYVKRCQNADGGFRYQLLPRRESKFPLSAASLVALYSAGIYEGSEIERGLKFVMRYVPVGDAIRDQDHYFYGHYYAVQALWHAGDADWRRWYPAIRDDLLRRQQAGGGWPERPICSEYSTAMACLILQVPNNYLPIFQK